MAENLLPCPFCGGVPHIFGDHHDVEGDRYWVVCCNRGCKVDHKLPRAEAIAAWNRRPAPMEAVAWRESVRQRVAEIVEAAIERHVPTTSLRHTLGDADAILQALYTHPVQGGEGQ